MALPRTVRSNSPTKGHMTGPSRLFSGFEWMVAGRYLRARRAESFISVITGFSLIGITLGVATLIIVMSVFNGHIIVQSATGAITDYDAIAAKLRMIPGVTNATPITEGQVLINVDDASYGALVRGIEHDDLQKLTAVSSTLSQDALAGYDEGQSVIIGQRLADKLGLKAGMTVTLIAPNGAVTPFGTTPRIKTYRVAGTFNVGMSEYDQTFIFMPLMQAQLFFGIDNAVQGIELMVDQPDQVAAWRQRVGQVVGPSARLIDWQQMNSSLFGA